MDDTSSGSGSDDGRTRGNEWEVVTRSLSSHSLSASTSFEAAVEVFTDTRKRLFLKWSLVGQGTGADSGGEASGGPTMHSNYFLCNPASPTHPLNRPTIDESQASNVPSAAVDDAPPEVQSIVAEKVANPVEKKESKKSEELDISGPGAKSGSCGSQMHELAGMDWMEPMPPGIGHRHTDYEQDEIGSASILYALAPETKAGMEPNFGQAGPLLGSCLSSPSSPAIVSRANSLRLSLGDELPGHMIDGDASSERGCSAEEEVTSLERDIFGEDAFFELQEANAAIDRQKLELEDRRSPSPLLGDSGYDEHTFEAWWKKRAALWCVQARQANTLWSIALAAAVMGLVILGHRWQHERCQNQQLRLQLCAKDEKISQLIFQLARLKEALSGRRRVPVVRTSTAYSSFHDRF